MKKRLRWWLWIAGDWVHSLGYSLLDEQPSQDTENAWWELTAGVYATQEEAEQLLDDLVGVLCGGYEDGSHHICVRDVVASSGPATAVHLTSTATIQYNWDRSDVAIDTDS